MFFHDIKLDQLCSRLSLQKNQLEALIREKVWILSFSGGADSVLSLLLLVLVHEVSIQKTFGTTLSILKQRHLILYYLDHGQKTNKSEQIKRIAIFEQCKKMLQDIKFLEVNWIEKKSKVAYIAKKINLSFEYAGSKIRTKDLRKLAIKFQGGIILGHHLSDWYETLIMRLNRGSSVNKLMPFKFQENSFLLRRYRPLFFIFRHEIRSILEKYQITYWDDPSNQDTSILRNQIRKNYPIKNYSGLKKTAFNMIDEKISINFDFKYEIISLSHEIRILINEKFKQFNQSLSKNNKILFRLNILEYLGLGALSSHYRWKLLRDNFILPPYFVEIENWGNQKYIAFHRGRYFLKEIQDKVIERLNVFLTKNKNKSYVMYPANKLTKRHKIKLHFGRKSVKALLKEKSISLRQQNHIFVILSKKDSEQIIFIPLSVFGLTDVYSIFDDFVSSVRLIN